MSQPADNIVVHIKTFHALLAGDADVDEDNVLDLPHRRPHPQRPLAQLVASAGFPEKDASEALIAYERIRKAAAATIRAARERALAARHAQHQPPALQGPWAGQEHDPVDLHGPKGAPPPG